MQTVDHNKNIIEVKDISFSYGKDEVLENITFEVHQGDYLGLVGPNGAGKTTLLKIMLGLLTPTTGSVKLFGEDIKEFSCWHKVGYVPQKATNFDARFPATILDVATMGRYGKLCCRINETDRALVKKALEQVGMWEYKDRLIGDLSGGQQQRVFIARALATQPEVIFLDEPTTGIDQKSQDEFYALLKSLNKEHGLTLVLISHDIERVTEEAMHIACIDKTLVCHSTPEEFLAESQSKHMFGQTVKLITPHHHEHTR
ncbi:MAG: metal ABC transporter ATP-binding protein [Candidatus Parcubacteria bacterium]|nr:metal ABC transporter ATP-binding protein [Candidatus Parcubacteria bacterium]